MLSADQKTRSPKNLGLVVSVVDNNHYCRKPMHHYLNLKLKEAYISWILYIFYFYFFSNHKLHQALHNMV